METIKGDGDGKEVREEDDEEEEGWGGKARIYTPAEARWTLLLAPCCRRHRHPNPRHWESSFRHHVDITSKTQFQFGVFQYRSVMSVETASIPEVVCLSDKNKRCWSL